MMASPQSSMPMIPVISYPIAACQSSAFASLKNGNGTL